MASFSTTLGAAKSHANYNHREIKNSTAQQMNMKKASTARLHDLRFSSDPDVIMKAVSSGEITQRQADRMLKQLSILNDILENPLQVPAIELPGPDLAKIGAQDIYSNDHDEEEASLSSFASALTDVVEALDAVYHEPERKEQPRSDATVERLLGLNQPGLIIVGARRSALRLSALSALFRLLPKGVRTTLIANGTHLDLVTHILATVARIPVNNIRNGLLLDEDWPRLTNGIQELNDYLDNVEFTSSVSTIDEIFEKIDATPSGGVVFIENFHLVSYDENIMNAMRRLRTAAHTNKVTVIAGVGLSHWMEVRSDKRPILADLFEYCSGVEHVADQIVLVAEETNGSVRATIFDGPQPIEVGLSSAKR